MSPTQISQAEVWAGAMMRVRTLLRRFWWILLTSTMLGLGVAALILFSEETWYKSTARMMVSGRIHVTEGNAYSEENQNFLGTQIELMKSPSVMEQAHARVRAEGRVTPAKISLLEVKAVPNTSIFVLQATGQSPQYTQAFLDALIKQYKDLKSDMRTRKSNAALSEITKEAYRLEKEWKSGEEELVKFQKEHSLVFLREGENTAARYLSGLNERLANLVTMKKMFERLDFDQLRGLQPPAKKPAEGETVKEGDQPEFLVQTEYLKAIQQLRVLEQKRAELLDTFKEDHPEVSALDDQITTQKRLMAMHREQSRAEFELHRQSLASQISALEEDIETWRTKALEIGGLIAEYGKIQAKAEQSKSLYEKLWANVGNVDLTKSLDQDVVSVLEEASPPVAVIPGLVRNLGSGAAAGFLLGALILFLLDRSNAQIASPEEFASSFTERILGIVPATSNAKQKLQVADDRHAFAESFYNIRSSLMFMPYDGPMPKTLLITSAVPNEGKSTLSANIALAFAFAGSRTLLVDGDLRRGEVHKTFDKPNDMGFSDILQKKIEWRAAILSTNTPNLFILPRGGVIAQPSKYLVHGSTDMLLQELHSEFDQIIIDSCPVLAADDTTSFAPKVEAVLVVARMGHVTRRNVASTIASLTARQANVLGVILNGIDARQTAYNYYSYTKYYTQPSTAEQPASPSAV